MNHLALLDNNVIRKLVGENAEYFQECFQRTCAELSLPGMQGQEVVVTPASLLEFIGVRVPKVESYKCDAEIAVIEAAAQANSVESASLADEFRIRLLQYYTAQLADKLSQEYLLNKARQQRIYIHESQRRWFDSMFISRIENSDELFFFYERLAIDKVYEHQFSGKAGKLIELLAILDIVKSVELERSITQVRALKKIWNSFKPKNAVEAEKLATSITKECILSNVTFVSKFFKFDSASDLLDLELVHCGVVGRPSASKLAPVLCFTCDPPVEIGIRIGMHKSFVKNAFEIAAEKKVVKSLPTVSPGHIIVLDNDFQVIKHYDASKVPYLFDEMLSIEMSESRVLSY